jgi:hypothetical protein
VCVYVFDKCLVRISVPPLTSVAGLMCARADAITGSTFVIVRSRSPLWETGRHPRNCSGSQPGLPVPYLPGRSGTSPRRWDFEKPRPADQFFRWILLVSTFFVASCETRALVSVRWSWSSVSLPPLEIESEQPCSCCSRLTYKL